MADKSFHQRLVLITAFIALIVAVTGYYFSSGKKNQQVVINTERNPTIGSPNAPVHMVFFEDLLCYNCRIFSQKVLPKIKEQFIDTGQVKCTIVLLAFMKGSQYPANAALCVGSSTPQQFYPYLQGLHEFQAEEESDWQSRANLLQIASDVGGIDLLQLRLCMRQKYFYDELQRNLEIAKKTMGKNFGTPTVYINGMPAPQLTFSAISKLIEKASL